MFAVPATLVVATLAVVLPDAQDTAPTAGPAATSTRVQEGCWLLPQWRKNRFAGVKIFRVPDASPLALAGFEAGDVIVRVAGSELSARSAFPDVLLETSAPVAVTVDRRGRRRVLWWPAFRR
jgi:S1-C subfamily serine protease